QLAIEYLYQELKKEGNSKILPLVYNVADPSPNLGWRGLEGKSLPKRGKPDLTLCLALIHHIVITANIPLKEFIDWLSSLGTSLVIEFVTKEDPMVKKLLLNKEDNYTDYEIEI
ncbi:MAG: methyltransferase, partial [Candidatus Mariimomonas ferrooxydans]